MKNDHGNQLQCQPARQARTQVFVLVQRELRNHQTISSPLISFDSNISPTLDAPLLSTLASVFSYQALIGTRGSSLSLKNLHDMCR